MTQEHPISPPPELVREWQIKIEYCSRRADREAFVAKVFQLGADYELEACCEWLVNEGHEYEHLALRDARRPKPSLKKQALETLCSMQIDPCWINGINTNADLMSKYDIIRRALEQLDD